MKSKIVKLLVCCLILVSLCACGSSTDKNDSSVGLGHSETSNAGVFAYKIDEANLSEAEIDETYSIIVDRTIRLPEVQAISYDGIVDGYAQFSIEVRNPRENFNDMVITPGKIEFVENYSSADEKVVITNDDIKNAESTVYNADGKVDYVVNIELTDEGTQKFAEATKNNIGKPIYILYDGGIVSYPTVATEITNGHVQINGLESKLQAEELAITITSKYLKHKVVKINN